MTRFTFVTAGCLFVATLYMALTNVSAHHDPRALSVEAWYKSSYQQRLRTAASALGQRHPRIRTAAGQFPGPGQAADFQEGRRLFERETFGGNGRTCRSCHSKDTGTVSPEDAQQRFQGNPDDPLFLHDGSDDDDNDGFGDGNGATRMLESATVLMRIPLHSNITLKNDPLATHVTVRRGIPTTLNTPALDPVLMLDGRQPSLPSQALGAITDHAQSILVTPSQLDLIANFQKSNQFFTSPGLAAFALGGPAPALPLGHTAAQKRGRIFFEDLPPDFSGPAPDFRPGFCATCHSGPLFNQTNAFLPLPLPPGSRFQTVLVSELNSARNPVIDFVFHNQLNDVFDGMNDGIIEVASPDPGRALITGIADDVVGFTFDSLNAFKIQPLRGIRKTAPYFHDNSAKTLEDVAQHYSLFFSIVLDPDGPGPAPPLQELSDQDKADIVAFLKLLD